MKRREVLVEAGTEKAGRGRVVPMTDELHAALAKLRASRPRPALDGSDFVFTMGDGAPLRRTVVALMLKAAVARCAEGDKIGPVKRPKVTFHCLRHSAASLMVAEGVPLFDVAKILGHSTLAVTKRYTHSAPKAGRAAIERLRAALAAPAKVTAASRTA